MAKPGRAGGRALAAPSGRSLRARSTAAIGTPASGVIQRARAEATFDDAGDIDDVDDKAGHDQLAAFDIDRIIQALEDRILAALDRRGGRYAGVF